MSSRKVKPFLLIACALLAGSGLASRIYSYATTVTNYPLSTSWAESGWIFEASSVFSTLLYKQSMPWPWLDPSRAILSGLIFLLPNSQIWMYRLWQLFLMFFTTVPLVVLLLRVARGNSPVKKNELILYGILIAWGILYFLQAPMNYHVLLGIIVILWLYDPEKPLFSLFLVILTSIWEGLGRVNWFLMPAVLISVIYLLSTPVKERQLVRYFTWPALWLAAGAFFSFITYYIYIKATHNVIFFLDPNMHYGFFKFKLWPNSAFKLGLIPGITLLSIPLICLILICILKNRIKIHWARAASILVILGIFFVGSTVVSLRAGGGFDLHNYDTFMLLLFTIACFMGMNVVSMDGQAAKSLIPLLENPILLLCLLIVPVYFAVKNIPRQMDLPFQESRDTIQAINTSIQSAGFNKGPVLFIDGRHLFAYHLIPDMQIFMPYEKIELMEMAMANNHPYFDKFRKDIQSQKFSLIVSEPLQLANQDVTTHFGFENNVWVEYVSFPILSYYQPVYTNKYTGLAIYAPVKK